MTSISSSSSSVLIPENLKLLISNLSSLITVKLDHTNYIIWKKQVQNILQATYLFGYLDGSIACPSPIVKDSTGKDVANTEFMKWKVIDSLLAIHLESHSKTSSSNGELTVAFSAVTAHNRNASHFSGNRGSNSMNRGRFSSSSSTAEAALHGQQPPRFPRAIIVATITEKLIVATSAAAITIIVSQSSLLRCFLILPLIFSDLCLGSL
ncbi:hypothetical protein C3L33_23347, partial [Rhododendron williamsianum]